ncbi:MAG TPA: aspartate dehydrogenase [Burkholderiaceae bacterium]|jgi:aspartate dehydrogenase|nr:aspartate dehydrogenase [Burkholderiaceae bacterium]
MTATGVRVGIAGLGAIGKSVAAALLQGIPGFVLAAVASRDPNKAAELLRDPPQPVRVCALEALAEHADLVIECAPAALLPNIALPVLSAGKQLVVLSAGALLSHPQLIEVARRHRGQILVPTGALLGLDAVSAAAEGTIASVTMITRKPPAGLAGAPYLVEHGIDVARIVEPTRVFSGTAREAARGFPANVNVAVALSLAGIGPDRTTIEVWADPTVTRNVHRIEVDSDSARFSMQIENIPSQENPRTGVITARSVVALLRKMSAPLRVGT